MKNKKQPNCDRLMPKDNKYVTYIDNSFDVESVKTFIKCHFSKEFKFFKFKIEETTRSLLIIYKNQLINFVRPHETLNISLEVDRAKIQTPFSDRKCVAMDIEKSFKCKINPNLNKTIFGVYDQNNKVLTIQDKIS